MTRTRRDPAVKAQEALDVARRRVDKLIAKRHALESDLKLLVAELDTASAVSEHLARHPLLATKETPA